jgi:methylthioribose-1-phosphate isomerase
MDPPHGSVERSPGWAKPNVDFTKMLDDAVDALKTDFVSGARQMADAALSSLSLLIDAAQHTAKSREELWHGAVHAMERLSSARPSMNAAVSSCLLRALDDIDQHWDLEEGDTNVERLVTIAREAIGIILQERQDAGEQLGKNFAYYVEGHAAYGGPNHEERLHKAMLRKVRRSNILTESMLGTLTTCSKTASHSRYLRSATAAQFAPLLSHF